MPGWRQTRPGSFRRKHERYSMWRTSGPVSEVDVTHRPPENMALKTQPAWRAFDCKRCGITIPKGDPVVVLEGKAGHPGCAQARLDKVATRWWTSMTNAERARMLREWSELPEVAEGLAAMEAEQEMEGK